ncbi:hypothetical protein [Agrilutibacter solisilvae]|uniref:Uncharacterized protein n=1 Tax=Agrilutibacter solisilvae TaxID=2763317 RepID=A0A974XW52_9GAMM|nr:hypothetical protein [Lysobacter solisilvae]QSX76986.1 hypothetical protein I8J32_009145 [Lysobacter solisilvae]
MWAAPAAGVCGATTASLAAGADCVVAGAGGAAGGGMAMAVVVAAGRGVRAGAGDWPAVSADACAGVVVTGLTGAGASRIRQSAAPPSATSSAAATPAGMAHRGPGAGGRGRDVDDGGEQVGRGAATALGFGLAQGFQDQRHG